MHRRRLLKCWSAEKNALGVYDETKCLPNTNQHSLLYPYLMIHIWNIVSTLINIFHKCESSIKGSSLDDSHTIWSTPHTHKHHGLLETAKGMVCFACGRLWVDGWDTALYTIFSKSERTETFASWLVPWLYFCATFVLCTFKWYAIN